MKNEETREMIRKFIIDKNGNATKNDVIKHMDKLSSRVPTLDMIRELEEDGIINVDRIDNRRGQGHYLRINNENEFNKINQQISEINFVIDTIEIPMDNILKILRKRPERESLREDVIFAYKRSIEKMLQFLLVHTSDTIVSEKSSQILYTKIIKSMQKLEHQYFYSETLDSLNRNIDTIKSILSITNKIGYNSRHKTRAFRYLIKKIIKFKERFKP